MPDSDLSQSRLSLSQIVRRLPADFSEIVLTRVQKDEPDLFATFMGVLSGALKYRPNIWRTWPKPRQREWLWTNLRSPRFADSARHLLQEWYFGARAQMLNAFLDAIGVSRDEKGVVTGEVPPELDPAKVAAGVETLLANFPPVEVSLYLRLFQLGRDDGWQAISDILDKDARLAL